MPKDKVCEKSLANGEEMPFTTETVGDSQYINFVCKSENKVAFEFLFKK